MVRAKHLDFFFAHKHIYFKVKLKLGDIYHE